MVVIVRIVAERYGNIHTSSPFNLPHNISMDYSVVTKATEEGVSAWVPGLPGCWSEGATEEEALTNIQDAIADYLAVAVDLSIRDAGAKSHTVRVNVV
jgi:predicted RNase H-like HicB family nuclease